MNRTFLFQNDSSNKFWRVYVEDAFLTVCFGKTGTLGLCESKMLQSNEEAIKEANELIAQKLKKGYVETVDAAFGEADFWSVIEKSKKYSEGDVDYQTNQITEILSARPVAEIIIFQNVFTKFHSQSYRSDWWGAAYLVNGGCSDDGFDYFRCWVILKGKKAYDEIWKNPENLTKYINYENIGECEGEALLSAASFAYEKKTNLDDFYDKTETPALPEITFDWQEEDDSLTIKFPKLSKKCRELGY